VHVDELRLGLLGQTRRVLAPTGVEVRQPLQLRYEWRYLVVAVDPRMGTLRWQWLERMRQEHLRPVVAAWDIDAVVWDGAGSHRGRTLRDLPLIRVFLPPYSPELNPVERLFQEIRRRVEGRIYDSLAEKQALVEAYLAELAADPARVRRLCGWDWVLKAIDQLPETRAEVVTT
jgi:hypothetical protein